MNLLSRSIRGSALLLLLMPLLAWANPKILISVKEAKELLGKPGVRFIFSDGDKSWVEGHIPGSVHAFAHDIHYLRDVKKCDGLPMCEGVAAKFIGSLGIDSETEVIAYDDGRGSNASGVWFYLKLYGVKKVRMLDGGFVTWKKMGFPVEEGAGSKVAAKSFKVKVDRSMVATKSEILVAIKSGGALLLDARHRLDEYNGKNLGSALISPGKEITVARGGFIPGAIFSPWTKYAGNKKGKANKHLFKKESKLKKQLKKLKKRGFSKDKTVISYCHVGLGRGTFQYAAMLMAGHTKSKVYVGSWNEWGNDSSLPLGKMK